MKRFALLFVGLAVFFVVPETRVAGAARLAAHRFSIRNLSGPAGSTFYPKAISGMGGVVGELSSHGGSTVVAAVYAGGLIRIGTPSGYADSAGIGISYMGSVLVQVWSTGSPSRRMVARPFNSHYIWERLRTGIPGYYPQSLQAIDANGDVAGTIQRIDSKDSQRAAVWFPDSKGAYPRVTALPGIGSSYSTGASTIWSGGGQVLVAGLALKKHSQAAIPLIWARTGRRWFRAVSDPAGLFVSVIGGAGKHIYAAGTTDTGSNYGEPVSQEVGTISFSSNGHGSLSRLVNLIRTREPWAGVEGVAAVGPAGAFEAVGGAAAGTGMPTEAVSWNGLRGATLYGRSLQRLLPERSSWKLKNAVGIDRLGDIVGVGTVRGRYAAYLLERIRRVQCACY